MKFLTGKRLRLLGYQLAAIAVLLILWQLLVSSGLLPSETPGVGPIATQVFSFLGYTGFWLDLARTIVTALIGWALAAVTGIVLGLLIGSSRFADRSTTVLVDFFRCFPVLALMPIVVLVLGTTDQMQVIMVWISCLWPVLVQTIQGTRRVEPVAARMCVIYRIPRRLFFRRVLYPTALPFIVTSLRIAASIAILIAIGVEVLSQTPGLGQDINLAQNAQRWDQAFAYIFYAGLLGWLITIGVAAAEKRLLRWARQA